MILLANNGEFSCWICLASPALNMYILHPYVFFFFGVTNFKIRTIYQLQLRSCFLSHGKLIFLAGFKSSTFCPSFLAASLINWSLISLVDLIAFLLIQYAAPKIGEPLRTSVRICLYTVWHWQDVLDCLALS